MKKRKWMCLGIIFLIMILNAAAVSASELDAADTDETESTGSFLNAEDETEGSGSFLNVQDITDFLDNIDYDELEKDLTAVLKVLESEDFQHLMSYQEMQDLIVVLLDKMEDFAIDDPDLVAKICVKLGVSEDLAGLLPPLIREYEYSKEDLEKLISSDVSREKREAALMLLQDPEVISLVGKIVEAHGEAVAG